MNGNTSDAELMIGIVARLGVDIKAAVATLRSTLAEYGYHAVEIHVTDGVRELRGYETLPTAPINDRIEHYIGACNEVREKTGLKDIMARFAISQIMDERKRALPEDRSGWKRAYIINQLKRTEETKLLRSIYGEHYLQISCHAHETDRLTRLSTLIANDHPGKPKASAWKGPAWKLILDDEAQEDQEFGQRVRDVFPLSDVVVDASEEAPLSRGIERFLRVIFGDPRVTPTREEYGMQLANTASLRSSDLSRQVGAAILNCHSEVQALGCNEVAKAGCGTYWAEEEPDHRDFQWRKYSNEERKREVLLDLALRMQKAGLIAAVYATPELLSTALLERDDEIIKHSQIMDSLEYGRSIHAEMNAITDAARGGHAVRGCMLYSNTFPCHNCAKHIVASGISEVVYLRPYPKSYADELFVDSIAIDPKGCAKGKVPFRQFIGIVGALYERVFAKVRWKNDDGTVPAFDKSAAALVQSTPLPLTAYLGKEAEILNNLGTVLDAKGLRPDATEAQTPA
jgi:cytidine deaminase